YLELLDEVGFAQPPTPIAGNALVMLARTGASLIPETLADALRPGVRLVLSQPVTDPCGQYTRLAFQRAGLMAQLRAKGEWGELAFRRGSVALVEALDQGEADVAVLYRSEAVHARHTLIALSAPLDLADEIVFCATVTTRSTERETAEAFIAFLRGPDGQALLEAAGFRPLMRGQGAL
ncbi:MAG: substrate-binding domain-containing protein, partial [Thermomicrobium sp.]|nr:substrate-binding domain-containing protein [Thermomicrobium sp.]